ASSTIISTFNSLTLSPALAAILLKPKNKGSHQALPAVAIAALGAWLGYARLSPGLEHWLIGFDPKHLQTLGESAKHAFAARQAIWLSSHYPARYDQLVHAAPWLGTFAGGLITFLLTRPLNWAMGGFFAIFNRGFDLAGRTYTRIVGGLLRITVLVLI